VAVHLLALIAEGSVNIVGLAAESGQLKGTVSKYVQRLVDAGLVARSPVPGNRKEIRLSLTGDGEIVARVYRQMHDEMDRGLADFLLRYSAAELPTVTKILSDPIRTEKAGARLVTDPLGGAPDSAADPASGSAAHSAVPRRGRRHLAGRRAPWQG
jgi:DNA-binding MarR family transcriptional regulator